MNWYQYFGSSLPIREENKLLIHLFHTYFLNIYYILGIVLGSRESEVNQTPALPTRSQLSCACAWVCVGVCWGSLRNKRPFRSCVRSLTREGYPGSRCLGHVRQEKLPGEGASNRKYEPESAKWDQGGRVQCFRWRRNTHQQGSGSGNECPKLVSALMPSRKLTWPPDSPLLPP